MDDLSKWLCKASYRAEQIPGLVIVTARGSHRTGGYQVWFEQSPVRIFPPELILYHERPELGPDVLKPFSVAHSFEASDPVERVVVQDHDGRHEIPVEQVPDAVEMCDGLEEEVDVHSRVYTADEMPEERTANAGSPHPPAQRLPTS